ncbi:MAG: hypothetical protein ACR2KV_13350 [Solirubrobacteraceae bacterium]
MLDLLCADRSTDDRRAPGDLDRNRANAGQGVMCRLGARGWADAITKAATVRVTLPPV